MLAWFIVAMMASPIVAASPSPEPSATPLREIGRVRSSSFCTALVTRIQPAVGGILANDGALEQGYRGLAAMASDVIPKAASDKAAVQLDRMRIDRSVSAMTRNLRIVDDLLAQPTAKNATTSASTDVSLQPLQEQLRYVVMRQRDALNVLSGTVETDRLGEMQHDNADATQATTVAGIRPQGSLAVTSNASLSAAGLPRAPSDAIDLRAVLDGHMLGNTSARQAAIVQAFRVNIDAHERTASALLTDAASACGGSGGQRPANP